MCQDARPRWAQAWGRRNRIPHLDGVRRGLLPSTSEGCQVGVGRCPAVLARSGERAGVMDTEATRRPGTRQRCQQALGRSHLGAESTPRIIDTPGSAPLTPLVPANMPRGQQFVWPLIWTVVSISSCQVAKRGTETHTHTQRTESKTERERDRERKRERESELEREREREKHGGRDRPRDEERPSEE